jgi:hypothetical protein
MARLSVVQAGILLLIAAAAAALSTLGLGGTSSGAGQSASIALIAVDGDISGNAPRTVGAIDECVSASVGQPVEVDIVVPSPGVPAHRGIAAFQLRLFYDPAIVWVTADDSSQLLAQATGSTVIAFSDVAVTGAPNTSGDYLSVAVDFGSGIEPTGASETGPGVLARLTLLTQGEGTSPLIVTDVEIADDDSEKIPVDSVQSGSIHVGEPCDEDADGGEQDTQEEEEGSEQGQQPTPPPAALTTTSAPDQDTDGDGLSDAQEQQLGTNPNKLDTDGDGYSDNDENAQGSDPLDASSTPEASPPAEVPNGGGPPPRVGGTSAWFVVSGLIATLGGASLLIAGKLTFRGLTRRGPSPHRD